MKSVLIGLAVVTSSLTLFALSPAGANADSWTDLASHFVPVLGGDSCIEIDADERWEIGYDHYQHEQAVRDDPPYYRTYNFAEEVAQATWWRDPLVDEHSNGNRRGWLVNLPELREGRDFPVFYPCDVNYGNARSGGCVPDNRDYDCPELRAWGIVDVPVTGDDWMLLDDDHDGLGCEFQPTTP